MNTDLEQIQIIFSAQLASLQSKVKIFKSLLTEEQLNIYTESILKGKEVFLKNNQDMTAETKEEVSKYFS